MHIQLDGSNVKLNQRQVQHLYWRAGFGPAYPEVTRAIGKSAEALTEELFAQSAKPAYLNVVDEEKFSFVGMNQYTKEEKKKLRAEARNAWADLNLAWIQQLGTAQTPLREKMTLFWHGHFATSESRPLLMQMQNNTIRQHALGNFRTLLFAIAKDPAMLRYLNNLANKKQSPNENFAREVMELFTLGRGHYTENDVKNAARAFTGWQYKDNLDFVEVSYQHDTGEKIFLGQTGDFGGEDVLDIILAQKQTARFIALKIYKYFVNAEVVDDAIVEQLADTFYASDYDIGTLMRSIFTSGWFYDENNLGQQIKSPVVFIAGLQHAFGIEFLQDESLIYLQKILGQTLLAPPNVAGWPEGREWIDSSTLMFRTKLPELIFDASEITEEAKDSGDVMDPSNSNRKPQKIEARIRWDQFAGNFSTLKREDLPEALSHYLLQHPVNTQLITDGLGKLSEEEFIKEMVRRITYFPEFQLC